MTFNSLVCLIAFLVVFSANCKDKQPLIDVNQLLGTFAKAQNECGKIELFQCREKIKSASENCSKYNFTCIKKILDSSECEVCFCKVYPEHCKNNLLKQTSQGNSGSSSDKQTSSDSGLGLENIMDTLQIASTIFAGNKDKDSSKDKGKDDKSNLLNVGKLGNILNNPLFQQEQQKIMESITSDKKKSETFDSIQQQLMSKLMTNPQLASQLMSGKLDAGNIMELLGSDLVSQMEGIFDDSGEGSENNKAEETPSTPAKNENKNAKNNNNNNNFTPNNNQPKTSDEEETQSKKNSFTFADSGENKNKLDETNENNQNKNSKQNVKEDDIATLECPKELLITCRWKLMKNLYRCINTSDLKRCIADQENSRQCEPCQCLVSKKLC